MVDGNYFFHIAGDVKCWWNTASEQRENIGCDLSFTCFQDESLTFSYLPWNFAEPS